MCAVRTPGLRYAAGQSCTRCATCASRTRPSRPDRARGRVQKAYEAARQEGESLAARLKAVTDASLAERSALTDAQIAASQARSTCLSSSQA
jgi:hypothetical protein